MKHRIIGGIVSALIFSVLLACMVHHDHVKRSLMGREAFLAEQGDRFDRHFSKPAPLALDLFICLFLGGGLFGAYELAAFGMSKIAGSLDKPGQKT